MEKLIFISTKFKDANNEEHINVLEEFLDDLGYQTYTPVKKLVDFGRKDTHLLTDHKKFMDAIKEKVISADCVLVDWQEKGVGIGVEAGAGWILDKQIIVIHPEDIEVSMTIEGIATKIISYTSHGELKEKLGSYL
jgi:2'-deoxynucleoside 5'-phosphate N-hydrolase